MSSFNYQDLNKGHRLRLRERFIKTGGDGLGEYEILELLLTYAIPRKDVKPIAKELLFRFKTFSRALDASAADLKKTKGVGENAAALLNLVREAIVLKARNQVWKKSALTHPQAVRAFAEAKLAGRPHEAFLVIFLTVQNEVMGETVINEGTVDQVAVYPRRVIQEALDRHAGGLLLVHNHPSGHTNPSEDDKRLTRALQSAARLMDIRVVDHLIVGPEGEYFSFCERGMI